VVVKENLTGGLGQDFKRAEESGSLENCLVIRTFLVMTRRITIHFKPGGASGILRPIGIFKRAETSRAESVGWSRDLQRAT